MTGATGPQGPAGPVAGTDTQLVYNDSGSAAGAAVTYDKTTGNVGIGTAAAATEKLEVNGTVKATALAGDGALVPNTPMVFGYARLNDGGALQAAETTFGNGSAETVVANGMTWNTDDFTNNKFDIQVSGTYEVVLTGTIHYQNMNNHWIILRIKVNNVQMQNASYFTLIGFNTGDRIIPGSVTWTGQLNSGDAVTVTHQSMGRGSEPGFSTTCSFDNFDGNTVNYPECSSGAGDWIAFTKGSTLSVRRLK